MTKCKRCGEHLHEHTKADRAYCRYKEFNRSRYVEICKHSKNKSNQLFHNYDTFKTIERYQNAVWHPFTLDYIRKPEIDILLKHHGRYMVRLKGQSEIVRMMYTDYTKETECEILKNIRDTPEFIDCRPENSDKWIRYGVGSSLEWTEVIKRY